MKEILDKVIEACRELPREDRLNKVFVHTSMELQRIENLLVNYGRWDKGVYLLERGHLTMLRRYLERLKKIRSYYYEASEGQPLPEILRPPIVEEGELIKIKREVKPPFEGREERTVIHLSFTGCRAKHIEDNGRIIIVITDHPIKGD